MKKVCGWLAIIYCAKKDSKIQSEILCASEA
jgi:hypothetical protein